jgi:glycosyltransferase involved in cell wall biosynthesis
VTQTPIGNLRLLLVTDAVGGVWVYSIELARALAPLGIETVLAVMGPPPSARQREEAAGIKLIDTGLPLDWLDTNPDELRRAGELLANFARIENADVVQTNSAALLADVRFEQPCIAVQHSCVASWWAAVKGTPLPYTFEWRRDLVECGLNQAATVVAPSIAFAAETALIYDVGSSVVAVHNGSRPAFTCSSGQADFVLTAGRLWDEGKNVATLDGAASRLKVPFEAAGAQQGPTGAAVQLKHIHGLGEVSSARLATLLAARPIFTSASLYEPFGLSVLEAAHAGCTLVLSDIPTHREIWGGAAIFVSARDDNAFVSAIQDLLDDPDERQQLGQLARARAQIYTPERMARGMADIYARVARPHFMPQAIAGAA